MFGVSLSLPTAPGSSRSFFAQQTQLLVDIQLSRESPAPRWSRLYMEYLRCHRRVPAKSNRLLCAEFKSVTVAPFEARPPRPSAEGRKRWRNGRRITDQGLAGPFTITRSSKTGTWFPQFPPPQVLAQCGTGYVLNVLLVQKEGRKGGRETVPLCKQDGSNSKGSIITVKESAAMESCLPRAVTVSLCKFSSAFHDC